MNRRSVSLLTAMLLTFGLSVTAPGAWADPGKIIGRIEVGNIQQPIRKPDIVRATVEMRHGRYAVHFRVSEPMRVRFCALTRKSIGKQLKIIIDGKTVISALVMEGICGGNVMLSGNYTKAEAEALASKLR